MHYVRFLRAPKLRPGRGNRLEVQLLFTITTDLGDSFLHPEKGLDLQVTASASSSAGTSTWLLSDPGRLYWEPGMRVAKPTLDLPIAFERAIQAGVRIQICVRASEPSQHADGAAKILAIASEKPRYRKEAVRMGAVMPAWISLNRAGGGTDVSMRRLQVSDSPTGFGYVEVEEEIGESIARHVWDAGVVALCAIAGIDTAPDNESSKRPCMRALKDLFYSRKAINVLELGCGVGILGVGLAAVYPKLSRGQCTILMTDLAEAEERARSNMARLHPQPSESEEPPVRMLYENLDWEDGRQGRFGKEVESRPWDLVMLSDCTYNVDMLPALVETLSAVHSSNLKLVPGEPFTTQVFLATKPRHASERELFELMKKEGWETRHKQVLQLPVLGGEPESVELYLFDKSSMVEESR
ncbi:putative methyltransferase-domain-containing protein [Dactylonectria macrodidyma]|uniref:Methyltransferase-domain-containing protein n=1 Tax=Dactylonectria macrodidyma TaxID=307937 RepID=A0A9P9JHZ5_9HYPO|nr:putative methyltransferase-domain-containing protein [Dactylonectria macrodidyma]